MPQQRVSKLAVKAPIAASLLEARSYHLLADRSRIAAASHGRPCGDRSRLAVLHHTSALVTAASQPTDRATFVGSGARRRADSDGSPCSPDCDLPP
jgi:hypothetical protein